jgi:hypothetical protein
MIGGSFEPGDDTPRAVSENYFKSICPESKRTIIYTDNVINETMRYSKTIGVAHMFDLIVEKINSIDNPCVQIDEESPGLFDMW